MNNKNSNNTILEIKNVTISFGGEAVIKDINISLAEGELVSLLGKSGSGKTTLFNIISGLSKPDTGQVLLKGEDITNSTGNVSYMLQKDLLLPFRTIEDNVALPLLMNGMKKKEAREKVSPYFEEFGLEGTQKDYPAQLSGGMRQRAALLRTYMFSKDVALLDEPFSALDTFTKSQMHSWYLDVMEKIQLTTLFVTHDIDESILLSDRIYLLTGRPGVIEDEIIINEPRPRGEEFLLSQNFLDHKKKILSVL
jgi:ABC-type nitrate/sulfonate/bicarbonate transport system ATPase subunit